eukprot:3936725-Rhodomonas_salina.1
MCIRDSLTSPPLHFTPLHSHRVQFPSPPLPSPPDKGRAGWRKRNGGGEVMISTTQCERTKTPGPSRSPADRALTPGPIVHADARPADWTEAADDGEGRDCGSSRRPGLMGTSWRRRGSN